MKWTLENSLPFDVHRRQCNPENVAQLVDLARQGKSEIGSPHTNIEKENAGLEELVRSTFYANVRLRREFGIDAKVSMLTDISGTIWSSRTRFRG